MSVWAFECMPVSIEFPAVRLEVRCRVLQRVATGCSVLQRIWVCCGVIKCDAVRCSVCVCVYDLQNRRLDCEFRSIALCCTVLNRMCCSVLQCVAVCCSVLQCVAVRCSALQCVAVRCSVRMTCKIDVLTVRLEALYFSSCLFPLPRYVTFSPPISNVKTCYMCI